MSPPAIRIGSRVKVRDNGNGTERWWEGWVVEMDGPERNVPVVHVDGWRDPCRWDHCIPVPDDAAGDCNPADDDSFPTWHGAVPRTPATAPAAQQATPSVGDHVTVTTGFMSNNEDAVFLRAGLQGTVELVDDKFVIIKFDELPNVQGVFQHNFGHITFRPPPPPRATPPSPRTAAAALRLPDDAASAGAPPAPLPPAPPPAASADAHPPGAGWAPQMHCGSGHALRRMKIGEGAGQSGYRAHSCSRCHNEVADEVWRCVACDYDICSSCAGELALVVEQQGAPSVGLPAPSAAEHWRTARAVPPAYAAPPASAEQCRMETIVDPTGATTVGWELWRASPGVRIATMIAANSGRPGGACGCEDARGRPYVERVHPGHCTQEEDIVSNWLVTHCGHDSAQQGALFGRTIFRQWGMTDATGHGTETLQGVDYSTAGGAAADPREAAVYGDAWVVRDCMLSAKRIDRALPRYRCKSYDAAARWPTALVFVAGPNAAPGSLKAGRDASSSMQRTYSHASAASYAFFREGVKAALRAAADAAVRAGATVLLLARASCGVYAGPHYARINAEFDIIVDEVLSERVGPAVQLGTEPYTRGMYLSRVICPMLS